MNPPDRVRAATGAALLSGRRLQRRLGLSTAGAALVGLAVAVVGLASGVLALVGEDMTDGGGLVGQDASRLGFVTDHRTPWLVAVSKVLALLGSAPVLVGVGVAIGALLWLGGSRLAVAAAPLASLLVTGAVVSVVKPWVGRGRPAIPVRMVAESEPSFPSGHAADTTALLVALAIVLAVVVLHRPLLRVLAVVAAFGVSGAVGLSRLVLGVHWPSDVVAGWALGTLVAVALTAGVLLAVRVLAPPDPGPGSGSRAWARLVVLLTLQRRREHAVVRS